MPCAKCPTANQNDILDGCRQRVLAAAPDIIDALIVKSREGSYQHAKFLFDLLETKPSKRASDDEADEVPGPSLAEILLERLQLVEGDAVEPETPDA